MMVCQYSLFVLLVISIFGCKDRSTSSIKSLVEDVQVQSLFSAPTDEFVRTGNQIVVMNEDAPDYGKSLDVQ